ncbi:hypothetical protein F5972_01600 [Microbispora cellulosiformans]|uniref:Uncharacterized protein n=1 Tax=Microbispora cellulosiformans TaxID=2614688 RepID=A0A5J5KCN3_9ACTN|nr:hypothetical protein [Microbispora cellulosiformans]KAA9381558.1 hypothetical protein F5972_01600 [Microbispora cellulosiformans]
MDKTDDLGPEHDRRPADHARHTGTAGSADVRTVTDYACLHTTPRCALPQKLWQVHIDVVGIGG